MFKLILNAPIPAGCSQALEDQGQVPLEAPEDNNVCQIAGYNLGVLKKVVQLSAPGTIDTILSYGRCNIMNQGKPKVTRSL